MEKIKRFIACEKGKDVLTIVILVLVGLGSFQLGRLSVGGAMPGIGIEYTEIAQNQPAGVSLSGALADTTDTSAGADSNKMATTKDTSKPFFASSRGKKYYSADCNAGKTIKQENRVYFDNREGAEHAGYELSSSCR